MLNRALPYPQLHMGLIQRRGQLINLGLQLLFPRRRTGLAALGQPSPARLQKLGLPDTVVTQVLDLEDLIARIARLRHLLRWRGARPGSRRRVRRPLGIRLPGIRTP